MNYARADGAQGWRELTEDTLDRCYASFDHLSRTENSKSYSLLRSLIRKKTPSLDISDARRQWLNGLERALLHKVPFPTGEAEQLE